MAKKRAVESWQMIRIGAPVSWITAYGAPSVTSACPPSTASAARSSSANSVSSTSMPRSRTRSSAISRLRVSTPSMSPSATRRLPSTAAGLSPAPGVPPAVGGSAPSWPHPATNSARARTGTTNFMLSAPGHAIWTSAGCSLRAAGIVRPVPPASGRDRRGFLLLHSTIERQPARLGIAELADQVVARLLDQATRAGEIRDQPEVLLQRLAVDEDGLDVRDVGGADDRADRIDDRRDVDRLGV